MTVTQPSGKTRFVAASLLWVPWLVSAWPFFALFIEFQCRQLGKCGAEWWYYARLYSHIFLYPITFGLISTVLLHRPWIRSVHYLCCLPKHTRTRKVGFIAISMLLVVGFAIYVEFFEHHPDTIADKKCEKLLKGNGNLTKYKGATPAAWSIMPEVMKTTDEGMKIRTLLKNRCMRIPERLDNSDKCEFQLSLPMISSTLSQLCVSRRTLLSNVEKCEFQEKLSILWDDGKGSLSYTELFYRAGFVAMTILFSVLFTTIFIATTRDSVDQKDLENRRMMNLLAIALLFATFWVFMRIAFLAEKLSIYPEDPLLIFNWFILLIFVALYTHLIARLWLKSGFERYERHLGFALSAAGVIIGVVGLFGSSPLSAEWIPSVLVRIFGTGGTPLTYIAVLLFLFIVHFPYILRLLEDDQKSSDSKQQGTT